MNDTDEPPGGSARIEPHESPREREARLELAALLARSPIPAEELVEAVDVLGHVRRTLTIAGDVRETLPRYLDENPQTVIALAYFDLDLYEPTRLVLEAIRPYLTGGSLLAFDQVGHAKWPGETRPLREDVAGAVRG